MQKFLWKLNCHVDWFTPLQIGIVRSYKYSVPVCCCTHNVLAIKEHQGKPHNGRKSTTADFLQTVSMNQQHKKKGCNSRDQEKWHHKHSVPRRITGAGKVHLQQLLHTSQKEAKNHIQGNRTLSKPLHEAFHQLYPRSHSDDDKLHNLKSADDVEWFGKGIAYSLITSSTCAFVTTNQFYLASTSRYILTVFF